MGGSEHGVGKYLACEFEYFLTNSAMLRVLGWRRGRAGKED